MLFFFAVFPLVSFAYLKNSLMSDYNLPFIPSVLSVHWEMMPQEWDDSGLHGHKYFADIYQYAPFTDYNNLYFNVGSTLPLHCLGHFVDADCF